MHFLDYIFIFILAYGFISGFRTGFLAQLVGFLVLIVLYFFSGIITQYIQNQLIAHHIITENHASIIGFIVGVVCLFLAIKIIFFVVEKVVKLLMLNFFNRVFGGIFGVLKIAILCIFFIYLFEKLNALFNFTQTDDLPSYFYQFFKNFGISFINAFVQ